MGVNAASTSLRPPVEKLAIAPDAFVQHHLSDDVVEFLAVGADIGPGADQPLLFAGEKNEANGASGANPGGFDGPQSVDDQSSVAAVVERARA